MYNKLKVKRYSTLANVDQTGEKIVTRKPMTYTYEEFTKQYDDAYFLRLYCKIRFFEEESQFTKEEQERIIDNLNELLDINFEMSVDSFEHILNKTFDYRGSLSYISNRLDKTRG